MPSGTIQRRQQISREYPTVNEAIAYEDGFKDGKDYWEPALIKRLTQWLLDRNIIRPSLFDHQGYVAVQTNGFEVTEFKQLGEPNGNDQ